MYSYHIHSTFSDGKGKPEEIVLAALNNGFVSLGFSDHGHTPFDLRYCMTDEPGYIAEITRLKEAYHDHIRLYLGIEEDAFSLVDRASYDYIIGSCHYVYKDGTYYPIDSNRNYHRKCLAAFANDHLAFAESYFSFFCDYIKTRKPDIVGHFDLITKFDEAEAPLFLHDANYHQMAEKYITSVARSGCIFEVNTGAVARGVRKTVYPYENLLAILQKNDTPIILSSDSHALDTLDFAFAETKYLLKNIGFRKAYTFLNGEFQAYEL